MKNKRIISPYLFALIVICLTFPFVTVSCGGGKICSLSGYELALYSLLYCILQRLSTIYICINVKRKWGRRINSSSFFMINS